jgi:hypothetical protein
MKNDEIEIKFSPTQKLPPGYRVLQIDSGHYLWVDDKGRESTISVDRFDAYRGAWKDYKKLGETLVAAFNEPLELSDRLQEARRISPASMNRKITL